MRAIWVSHSSIRRVTAMLLAALRAIIFIAFVANASATGQVAASHSPSAGHALICVYRKGGMLGAAGHPVIFVGDYLLAQLHLSNYACTDVPPGSIVVTATFAFGERFALPEPIGSWATLPGCVALDWRKLAAAPPDDISTCERELRLLVKECGIYQTITGCSGPGCIRIVTTHIPYCAPKLNGSADAFLFLALAPQLRDALLNGIHKTRFGNLHIQLPIDAKAGNTYYVKWSVSGSGGETKLIDSATGEKEIRNLHVAEYARGPASRP